MKSIYSSVIIAIFLLIVIFVSFNYANQKDISEFCNNELNCILEIVTLENNPNYCEVLQNQEISKCYYLSSQKLNSSQLCDFTINSSNCYFDLAIKTLNSNLCNSTLNNDECIYNIAIKSNDELICEISSNKYFCYYSYAIKKEDIKICEKTNDYKGACKDRIINKTNI